MTEWYEDGGSIAYPMTPENAAAKIVAMHLSDLPADRQDAVRAAIEEWGSAWGSASADTEYESVSRSS